MRQVTAWLFYTLNYALFHCFELMEGQFTELELEVIIFCDHNDDLLVLKQWKGVY